MAHQITGAAWMAARARALIADPPGSGKSLQALTAIERLGLPAAIICPAVAVGVWEDEIAEFGFGHQIRIQATTEAVLPPQPGECVITTYDRVKFFPSPQKFGIVCDEAHLVKNSASARHKRTKIAIAQTKGYVWAQTGTPILRTPDDLWSILQILGVEKQTYRNRSNFLTQWGGYYDLGELKWNKPRKDAWAPVEPLLLRRARASMFDLPDRIRELWSLKLSNADNRRFREISEKYPADDEKWETWASGGELAAALAKLSLVKAGLAIGPIEDLAPTTNNPIVVFTAHREAARVLATHFGWPSITGATEVDDRTRIRREFQAGEHCGIVCTIQAAGVALTLTRANTCVFVSQTYVPALNSQAEDRLYRLGQTRDVRTIFCRSDSALEKQIDKVLARKVHYMSVPEVIPE